MSRELPAQLTGDADDESQNAWKRSYKTVECPICLQAWKKGDRLVLAEPCGHLFHNRCMDGWVQSQLKQKLLKAVPGTNRIDPPCPLCRMPASTMRHIAAN